MTVVLAWPSQDYIEQRWAAWMAKGQVGDARMVLRMRLVFIIAAAGAVWAGVIL